MIPESVIDALIADLENKRAFRSIDYAIDRFKEIRKEAIPLEPVGKKELEWMDKIPEQSLEQKIKDRITFLEGWEHDLHSEIAIRLDELRKLLE